MPDAAYFNPTAYGGDEWWNRLVYGIVHVVADQKFMALFSLLFGAGVMLLISNLERKGQTVARIHYIRNGWLLIFGLAHATFIWSGDVLTVYALSAFVLYFARKLAPKWQLSIGLLIFFVPTILNLTIQNALPELAAADRQLMQTDWQPSPADIEAELAIFRGTYADQLAYRLASESAGKTSSGEDWTGLSLMVDFFARALGMMMMGMACYTWGILTAKRSNRFYWMMVLSGFAVGLPMAVWGLLLNMNAGWAWDYSIFAGRILNNFATPFVAAGYIGGIMLWSRGTLWTGLRTRLAAVGRTALTNYIGQSILATTIFYGFGLGLYGTVDRITQLVVVLAIWLLQLWLAPWWLARFRYGPLEWLWRWLTYFRWPMHLTRKSAEGQKLGSIS